MTRKSWFWITAVAMLASAPAWGATFGKVVAIGGHGSDLALDEARGVLYVANFTANRIEVMSLADNSIQTSMNVASQPSSLALSADGRFLVVAHFGNFTTPGTPRNALTVIDLNNSNQRQTFALGSAPLGVAFGLDNRALVVTAAEFILFDPLLGTTQVIDTITNVTAKTLPQPPANFPPQIVAASVAASTDGLRIVGLSDTIIFSYDVTQQSVRSLGYVSSPAMGPRVVSPGETGATFLAGWGMFDARGILTQFPNPTGILNVGSHAVDSRRGLIYAQVNETPPPAAGTGTGTGTGTPPATPAAAPPVLQILSADNLEPQERLQLPENLAGKSVLSSDGTTMYSISDSGVMILAVGDLSQARRVIPSSEDLVFRGNFCDRRVATQELTLVDPSGGSSDFTITTTTAGVTITPSSGTTPVTVRVRVDPNVFANQKGTVSAKLTIRSSRAVNLPASVRVLISGPEPDQRGTLVNVPGKLIDLLSDPTRNRFFVLRQDKNQVLVFDGNTASQVATLRTGNTPTQMAITFDRRWLLVGHDNSQFASVFDLETLEASQPIRFPFGKYPRSIASAGQTILASVRSASGPHGIARVDMFTRGATMLPTLGVYENTVDVNTVLVSSANGSSILAAQSDGNVLLYNANVDSFTISRKDFTALSGAYAASSFDQFVVGSNLLNASLVPMRQFETSTGLSSGFAFVDNLGFRTTAATSSSPGVIQRIELSGEGMRATRMVEAPVLSVVGPGTVFTRSIAPLQGRTAIINLTTSGFTVLPWSYDVAVATPRIDRVVNAADLQGAVAPGGLITLFGRDLSPVNVATRQIPLPTALGESCLSVNGVPVPMLFVSNAQINAQLPVQTVGNVTMILRTPGGVSDNFNVQILPAAPSVFRNGVAGPMNDIPTVYRADNGLLVTPSNPVHRGDEIIIYLTGMGVTSPLVQEGLPAPGDPAATPVIDVTVTLGGVNLPVNSAVALPGQVGIYEVRARVLQDVPLGFDMPLAVTQGSGGTSLPVRVVN